MTTATKELVVEAYTAAREAGLNEEIAFQFVVFMKEAFPHELEYQSSYFTTIIDRFKNGSIIAYSDYHCRESLSIAYQIVVLYGGLFGNWINVEY